MNQIATGLYQGALFDAVTGPMPEVDVAIVLTPESERVTLPGKPNLEIIRFPITDNHMGLDRWTLDRLSDICKRVADKRVLTLCFKGENRAGLASALILVHRGMTPEEAVNTVQSNGPVSTIGKPHALWNASFVRQIRSMAA